jgi:hypothetical protein
LIREFRVTEETLVGRVVDESLLLIELTSKDTERIEFLALTSVIGPEDSIAVREPRKKLVANDIVVSADLGNHVI